MRPQGEARGGRSPVGAVTDEQRSHAGCSDARIRRNLCGEVPGRRHRAERLAHVGPADEGTPRFVVASPRMRSLAFASALIALTVGAAHGDPTDQELAKRRYATGQLLFRSERYREALDEFLAARASLPRPEFDYNIGMCLARLNRPTEAADALERYMTAKPDDPDAANIWRTIAELRAQAAKLREATDGAHAAPPKVSPPVTAPVAAPPPVAPVAARPDATSDGVRTALLATGRGKAVVALSAFGVAAIVSGIATGSSALAERGRYDTGCNQGPCDAGLYAEGHGLAIATDVLISVGAASAVAAILLVVTRPQARAAVAAHKLPLVGVSAHSATFGFAF
jgi:hypothetical protein